MFCSPVYNTPDLKGFFFCLRSDSLKQSLRQRFRCLWLIAGMSFWKHLKESTVSKIRKGKEVRKDMVSAKAWPALIDLCGELMPRLKDSRTG